MTQNYPPQPYVMNNTSMNNINPYPQIPSPIIVANPNQINQAAKNMENNILNHQDKLHHKQETERLKEKIEDLRFAKLEDKLDNIQRAATNANNNNNNNININVNQNQPVFVPTPTIADDRLNYSSGYFCLFLCLNIFFPGIGTMVAGCMFGKDNDAGKDRTGELICQGILQLCTAFFFFGWVYAIIHATRYFKGGCC